MQENIVIKLPKEVEEIFSVIEEYGAEAYIVGGCVRDSIMRREIHDWDICTPVIACELMAHFNELGYKVIPTGLKHGTITVVMNEKNFEITTFRKDGKYSDGRHPDNVEFTSELYEDLKRRDFTINAMAYNHKTGLIDPFNGMGDIKYKVIHCVGSPIERFNEDGLRILRALRFASVLGFEIDLYTDIGIEETYAILNKIAKERINSELCKIILGDHCAKILHKYKEIFCYIIPYFYKIEYFEQNNPYHEFTVWNHTLMALNHCLTEDLVVRLALLFHDIGKPYSWQYASDDTGNRMTFHGHAAKSVEITDKIMRELRFDNDTRTKVLELIKYHDSELINDDKHVRRWISKIGEEQFKRLVLVRFCDICGQKFCCDESRASDVVSILYTIKKLSNEKSCFTLKNLAVNGYDLMKIGFTEGENIGKTLKQLLDMVLDGMPNEHDRLLNEAAKILKGE